jgi:hypothetical protein
MPIEVGRSIRPPDGSSFAELPFSVVDGLVGCIFRWPITGDFGPI